MRGQTQLPTLVTIPQAPGLTEHVLRLRGAPLVLLWGEAGLRERRSRGWARPAAPGALWLSLLLTPGDNYLCWGFFACGKAQLDSF